MPTYEYRCSDCGEHLEVVQSFHDDPLEECGLCQGKLRRVFHPVGIVFKGSGFYSTDNRGSSSMSATASEKKADDVPCGTGSCATSEACPAKETA